jgi:hypothetical protein
MHNAVVHFNIAANRRIDAIPLLEGAPDVGYRLNHKAETPRRRQGISL